MSTNEDPILSLKEDLAAAVRVPPASAELPVTHLNSTDATRGQPLVQRAQTRRAELAAYLETLPATSLRERTDIETAISMVDEQLTGDLEQMSDATRAALSRWLELNKHLAELASDGAEKPA